MGVNVKRREFLTDLFILLLVCTEHSHITSSDFSFIWKPVSDAHPQVNG